jgi:hypothetical protein
MNNNVYVYAASYGDQYWLNPIEPFLRGNGKGVSVYTI